MEVKEEQQHMEKIWLKSYMPGVPAEINPDAYQSIPALFDSIFKQYAERNAFYNMGAYLTYEALDRHARDFAAYLQQVLKLNKGDRFAIMLPNILQYPVVLFGALRAGLTIVNINPLYTADELSRQINDAGVVAVIALSNFANTVEKALPHMPHLKHVFITEMGDLFPRHKAFFVNLMLKYVLKKIPAWQIPSAIKFKTALSDGSQQGFRPVDVQSTDIAFLQYTGGTTGVSKGAILTHRNMIANLQQAEAWFKGFMSGGKEIVITALPLYHIFSLLANGLFFTKLGGLNVLITNPRNVPSMIKDMSKFKFTAITAVNTLFNALLGYPQFKSLDFSRLRLSLGGGMAVQRAVALKWQEVTGAPLLEAYGLTETSPCVTINPANLTAYNGTIGLPVSSTDIAILDDNHQEVPLGESGELAVKGPQVMQGYWQNPEETAKVFTQDGWLLTGDIASIDEKGFVRLLERKKDMILVSGFNVYPNEVEDVITTLPGVNECAVIGVPDKHSGELVKAFIVMQDGANLTPDEVIRHCREHLTAYKVPKQVEFRTELPKSNVGKILRRALR